MKGYMFLLLILLIGTFERCFPQSDSGQVLTLATFIQSVKKYHPVARLAGIQVDKASAGLMSAKGNFDPLLQFDANSKTFDSKNYYYYNNPELYIPLPVGNLKAGVEYNGGDLLSPEISKGKTSYLGVELPLAKGLLMDKRRAILQQAKIFTRQSVQERLIIQNDLLFDAYTAYLLWAGAYQQYAIYCKFVEIAGKRLRLVRIAFAGGERALMDTTEAFTQLQNYQLLQNEAFLKWKNAGLELSNYLWKEGDSISILEDSQLPEKLQPFSDMSDKNAEDLIAKSTRQNPSLKIYDHKLNILEVERKLKLQSLLPYFSVKTNLLNKDYNVFKNTNSAFFENNYKWGVEFKIPFFLREARGDYKKVQLKMKETNLELLLKRKQTESKIHSYLNEYNALKQQLSIAQSMYLNYQSLQKNEELKFSQGESSLFLVNTRESKLLELQQKQIDLTVKYFKAKYAIEWAAGLLR